MVLVTILSLQPAESASNLGIFDKLIHFMVYFLMAILALVAFKSKGGRAAALLVTFSLGAILELGQGLVIDRNPSYGDAVANILGALSGVLTYRIWLRDKFSVSYPPE
jgi:VanZ family protein